MTAEYPEIDAALQRFGYYRLEPKAALSGRDAIVAQAGAVGFAIPDDYAWYCCAHGAGAFDKHAMLPLPAGCPLGPEFRVDILYAIGAHEDWNPLALLQDIYIDRLPAGMLPFGTDPGGNLLLLGTRQRTGVYAWDHEHRELTAGEFERRVGDLKRAKVDTQQLDIDQLLLLWDETFPARVSNPTGYGNLYRVGGSFAAACGALHEDA